MDSRTLLLALVLVLAGGRTALAVPMQLAHQGYLSDSDGGAVTGSVVITFSLWDEEESGSLVWTESRTVEVVDGSYSTLLGSGMPIAEVLIQEPSLWLQLEIGGEALLPRHPVASAPYAVVAETAVNLDGGTVNASSVSIAGSEIIDVNGSWTGGAGSLPWAAVGGIPADVADGDADVLGGLSCADGDRAVWSESEGLWDCGAPVSWETLSGVPAAVLDGDADTLASLSCAAGERIEWTGTVWACTPPIAVADMYLRDSGGLFGTAMVGAVVLCDDANDVVVFGGCKAAENGTTFITATGPAAENTSSTWAGGNTTSAVVALPGASERGGWGCTLRHDSNGAAVGSVFVVCLSVP